ncbi:anti-sigma factor [Conexibacter sp. DBS9H8]|uniref:anti-sigma factor family protein n=1 Tax=Conexibacter sp. DBS9H8 TaxID=2937801 RepID=UPI00200FEE0D|nr:zf-HC2 domain-containing protein [Conexibacter sp. DBS9H8]
MINPITRHRARCRQTRALMSDYLDDDLDPESRRRVARHTAWCPNCGRMLRTLSRTVSGLHHLGGLPDEPSDSQVS